MTAEIFFKNLADKTRLTLIMLIASEDELCVCELTHALVLSQPKISRHLAQLRESGILSQRRQGKWVYYRLSTLAPWQQQAVEGAQQESKTLLHELKIRLESMGAERPLRLANCCQ
jgi:ArsR family transcriptional regulator